MGLYDTIDSEVEIDIGKIRIKDWQTKELGNRMNIYKSGDEILKKFRKIRVIGNIYFRGDLLVDDDGKITGFVKDDEDR